MSVAREGGAVEAHSTLAARAGPCASNELMGASWRNEFVCSYGRTDLILETKLGVYNP